MGNKQIITMDDLRVCPYQTMEAKKIASGYDGIVCRVGNNLVAKMPLKRTDEEYDPRIDEMRIRAIPNIIHAYKVAKILEDEDIDATNPIGIFKVNFRGELRPANVINYLDGERLEDIGLDLGLFPGSNADNTMISQRKYDGIMNKFCSSKDRARDLGFYTNDTDKSNAIWVPKTNRVHLIDFSRWEVGGPHIDVDAKKVQTLQERMNNVEVQI